MTNKWTHTPPVPMTPLRGKAEIQIARAPPSTIPARSTEETLYELQVQQIELEIQNEQLRSTQIELEKSRDRYRDLYESSPVGYLTLNAVGQITEINPAGATMLGLERANLINCKPDAFIAYPESENWQRHFVSALTQECAPSFELTFHRGDRSTCDVLLESRRTADVNGKAALSVTLTDITAQRKEEEKLRQSESRYRSLFEHGHTVMLLIHPESGAIVDANSTACDYYGWTRTELLNLTISQINTLPADAVRREMHQAMTTQKNIFLFQHRLADGSIRDVESTCGPISIDGQELLYSIVHDVTESKHSSEQIHNLLREQKAILDSHIVGIARLKDRKYAWINPVFAEMLGYTPQDLIGQSTRIVYPSDEAYAAFAARSSPVTQSGDIFKAESQFKRKDGSFGWYEISGSTLSPGSDESIWACVDISERVKTVDELERHCNHLEGLVAERTEQLSIAKVQAESV